MFGMDNKDKQTVINNVMGLLFSISPNENFMLKNSLNELISTYYCDLASVTNSIYNIIPYCKSVVNKELIEYVEKESEKLSLSSLSISSSSNLSLINKKYLSRIEDIEDENIKNKLTCSKNIIDKFLNFEISKTEQFKKNILSKGNTVYGLVSEIINNAKDKSNEIKDNIKEANLMLKACDFLDYYYKTKNIRGSNIADVTFTNEYNVILKDIIKMYSNWKGGE